MSCVFPDLVTGLEEIQMEWLCWVKFAFGGCTTRRMAPSMGYCSRSGIWLVQPRAVEQFKCWAVLTLQFHRSVAAGHRTCLECIVPACVAAASQGFPRILQGLAVGLQGLHLCSVTVSTFDVQGLLPKSETYRLWLYYVNSMTPRLHRHPCRK